MSFKFVISYVFIHWFKHLDESDFVPIKLTNQGKMYVYNKVLGLNGTFYKYSVPIKYKYPVYATLWHNVAFKFCDSNIIGNAC